MKLAMVISGQGQVKWKLTPRLKFSENNNKYIFIIKIVTVKARFLNRLILFYIVRKVVASYYGATGKIAIEGEIHWPGGADGPPPDTPFCGYDNENPLCKKRGK